MIFVHSSVCKNQNISSLPNRPVSLNKQVINGFLKSRTLIIYDRNLCDFESVSFHTFDLQKIRIGKDRMIYFQHLTVFFFLFQKISVCSDIDGRRRYDFFTDRVDRRIRNLCK